MSMYYRGVAVALVCYDVGDRASFESIGDWLKNVRDKIKPGVPNVLYYLVGNKCDLDETSERKVSLEEG